MPRSPYQSEAWSPYPSEVWSPYPSQAWSPQLAQTASTEHEPFETALPDPSLTITPAFAAPPPNTKTGTPSVSASLNAPLRADGESEWQDWLADDTAVSQETQLAEDEEKSIRMGLLQEAMEELTEREKHILTERRLKDDPVTLEELAGQYGVSRERVRQIEARLKKRLGAYLREQIPDIKDIEFGA